MPTDTTVKPDALVGDPMKGQAVDPRVRTLRIGSMLACVALLFIVLPVLHFSGGISDADLNRIGRYLWTVCLL